MKITDKTWGYTMVVDHISGGSLGQWFPYLTDCFSELDCIDKKDITKITIIPRQFGDRMNPW